MLRQVDKPVLFVVNKIDGPAQEEGLGEFYALGVADLYPVSAEHRLGTRELIDELMSHLPEQEEEETWDGWWRDPVTGWWSRTG